MTKQKKNLITIGIDVYSVGLACSTVVYSYYAYFYDTVTSISWGLHLALFFILPMIGCALYFCIFGFKMVSRKMISSIFSSKSKQKVQANTELISMMNFSELDNEEKLELIERIKDSMKN